MKYHEKLIDEVPLAILDTETTGLYPALGHRVIELAILRLENWQETGQIDELINPGRRVSPSASRVNRIYDSDLIDALPFVTYTSRINELLDGALIVAHNASFDAGFLAAEWVLTGQDAITNTCACTLQLARNLYDFPKNRLIDVAASLGVRANRAHRAMDDVWTTAQVFRRMLRDLNEWDIHTVGQLMHAQGGPIYFPAPPPLRLPPPLDTAVGNRTPIGIRYMNESGRITERVIEPYYVRCYRGDYYLTAFCRLRNAQRTFRIDRILAAFSAYP